MHSRSRTTSSGLIKGPTAIDALSPTTAKSSKVYNPKNQRIALADLNNVHSTPNELTIFNKQLFPWKIRLTTTLRNQVHALFKNPPSTGVHWNRLTGTVHHRVVCSPVHAWPPTWNLSNKRPDSYWCFSYNRLQEKAVNKTKYTIRRINA